ncbi:MAG: hypothetical protein KF855_09855 [Acidobacteria bacterium]|nr:hypothetical protein [Acidobacteriota bacterium]
MLEILRTLSNQSKQTSLFGEALAADNSFRIDEGLNTRVVGEFWTSKQRQANSLHEVAYRACFKAQLPNFFISRLTSAGDFIYDPFSGRGTTVIEAALLGRNGIANDISPLGMNTEGNKSFFTDEVADFLDSLVPSDVGRTVIGDKIVRFEGFTDDCWESANENGKSRGDLEEEVIVDWAKRERQAGLTLLESGWWTLDLFCAIYKRR